MIDALLESGLMIVTHTALFVIGLIVGADVLKKMDFRSGFYYCLPVPSKEFHYEQNVRVVSGFFKGKEGVVRSCVRNKHFYNVRVANYHVILVSYKDLEIDGIKESKLKRYLDGKK